MCMWTRGTMQVSNDTGITLVRTARMFIESYLGSGRVSHRPDDAQSGIFVTLKKNNALRGCIGHVDPVGTTHDTLRSAAIAAATQDNRFPPVSAGEMDEIAVQVTIIGPMIHMGTSPSMYPDTIREGIDGLCVKKGETIGLLLPQVRLEYAWSALEFLEQTCQKAGLDHNCWKRPDVDVYRFEGHGFAELVPRGRICRM